MTLWRLTCAAVCLVWALPGSAQQRLTVAQAVELGVANNLDLQLLAAEVRVADARVRGSALVLRDNPELAGGIGPRLSDGADTLAYEAELTQELEVFGERGARVEGAKASRGAVVARLNAGRSEIIANVRHTFVRALAAEQRVARANDNLVMARQTLAAVERRVELGDSARIEQNAARIEVGRSVRALARARTSRATAIADLRLLLALPAAAELHLDGDLRTPFALPPDRLHIVQNALRARSDRAATLHDQRATRAEQTLAGREWLPRPRVGVRYEHEHGDHTVLGTLSFQLPVFDQNQGARGAAAARRTQAELATTAIDRRIEHEVLLAAARLGDAKEAVDAFEGQVVEALRDSLKLGQTAYEAGKIGLFELLLIRRDALEAQREHIEALEELRLAEAELARALGLQ
jgi:outer membrane protein, heavy metal efflux system